MTRSQPAQPNLEHLKKQVKDLLQDFAQGNPAGVEQFNSVVSTSATAQPKLADAQHVIPREYGFASWAKLKEHVQSLAPFDPVKALLAAVKINDDERVDQLLRHHPALQSKLNDPLPGA